MVAALHQAPLDFARQERPRTATAGQMFELSIRGDIARLNLCRPARRNAIPIEGWTRLASVLSKIHAGKILIVSGQTEEAFCAGADINEFHSFIDRPETVAHFRREMRHALNTLRDLSIPTIALVEGACYGAGVALAMACDMRIAGPEARFAITPAKLGISYPHEDVHRLLSLVGPGQASRLLFTAQAIDAEEAVRIGLADLIFTAGATARTDELAMAIALNEPHSLSSLKKAIRLAEAGIPQRNEQDEAFDAIFQSEGFAQRLKMLRRGKQ